MTIKNKRFFFTAVVLLCSVLRCAAQHFKVKAQLLPVATAGFCRIPLTPQLTAFANEDLSDIRIMTDSSYVPYIWDDRTAIAAQDSLIKIPVLTNVVNGNYSEVTIENTAGKGIAGIALEMVNTAAERYTKLSGSNDNSKWYVIDDSILFHRSFDEKKGTYQQMVSFPFSTYRYYHLRINNASSDPLNILGAGIYKSRPADTVHKQWVVNPATAFTQKDSNDHTSYVTIRSGRSYFVDRVTLAVAAPHLFSRAVAVYITGEGNDSAAFYGPVANVTISSEAPCIINIGGHKASGIIIAISNGDNQPLKINSVTTEQVQRSIIAWLEQGKTYSLMAGDPAAKAPDYDLSQFKNKIPAVLPVIVSDTPVALGTQATAVKAAGTGNMWLWVVIVLAISVLSLLTYRLMRDMKKDGHA